MERERDIERWLKGTVESLGGRFLKFVSPGNAGVPDRIAIMPGGRIWFIELKTDKGRLKPIQRWQQERLRDLGCTVRTINGRDEASDLIREMLEDVRRRKQDEIHTARLPETSDGAGH